MDWQDISTAPKDGTDILTAGSLSFGQHKIYVGHWSGWGGGVWRTTPETGNGCEISPTHWMPLPEPPKDKL